MIVKFFKFLHQHLNQEACKGNCLPSCDYNINNCAMGNHGIACDWMHALLCDIVASARLMKSRKQQHRGKNLEGRSCAKVEI